MKLTMRLIEALVCPAGSKDKLYFDDEQKGLAVRVTAGGSRTYLAQYTYLGTKRRVPLGSTAAISLKAAREATAAIMGAVAAGRDPAAERKEAAETQKEKEQKDSLTLEKLIQDWQALGLAGNKEGYRDHATTELRRGFKSFLGKPAADLTRAQVLKVYEDGVKAGKATTARNWVKYGRACFSWAVKRGQLEANPFRDQPLQPTASRERVLTDGELVEIWNAADSTTAFGGIVRTLLLTGQRRDEVAGMVWDELATDLSIWTLPGERVKNSNTHIVPLSPAVQDLIKQQHRRVRADGETDYVFGGRTGQFSGWSRCKERLDATILENRQIEAAKRGDDPALVKPIPGWVLHDLRRTVATGLQRLGVRLEVTEAVLNHVSGSKAGIVGVYQRHDWATEKREALNGWANHVSSLVGGTVDSDKVVRLRA